MKTLPNNQSGKRLFMRHTVALPPCCPVSKNPRSGSTITICYRANEQVLEVDDLYVYIHSFRGGLMGKEGKIEVRDMEGMIQRIADDCAEAVGVYTKVLAHLQLLPHQEMIVIARAEGRERNE